ncbi:hypothetical protein CHLRE_15g642976v5 [Chlamydomonas reinhardtii]|uniref:Uncharacterized protein n=1 Tax=Chlamydomonas reinhardtii TaxID=3055 RepID=A0A2K3CX09_CHLRE|nr:uncharacterized protein CHLRE_15g642976v5 [Chlamydomonas reinhardtii]PNW72826.1 hypothetical protein CHLRE_15g642976v5 [Chlamydomonas reinhardtii]
MQGQREAPFTYAALIPIMLGVIVASGVHTHDRPRREIGSHEPAALHELHQYNIPAALDFDVGTELISGGSCARGQLT